MPRTASEPNSRLAPEPTEDKAKRRISIQLHIDPKLQSKYLNPEEKKGKERSHFGLDFLGSQVKKISSNPPG